MWCSRAIGRHGFLEDAVDAVLDVERVVVGLDVDVGGATLERGEDGGVDQADDGADVFIAGQLFDGDVFVGIAVIAGDDVEGEAFAGFVEDALRLFGLLEQVGDLRERGDARDDAVAKEAGDFVEHHEARGIADRDDEHIGLLFDGHEVVAEHQFHRNGAEEVVLDLEVFEINKFGAIACRQGFSLGTLVETVYHRPRWHRDCRVSHI